MQPTFLPWLGYFAMIDWATDFVFLDNVQLTKRSWQTRNRISGPHGPIMLTLPVPRKPSRPLIVDAQLETGVLMENLLKTLKGVLGRAKQWDLVELLLCEAFARADEGVAAVNQTFIRSLCAQAGLETRFHLASQLKLSSGDGASRAGNLLRICHHFDAREYLSPIGSHAYLRKHNPFPESGVDLRFFNYCHPEYSQLHGPFVSHMSSVEALADLKPQDFGALVRSGWRNPLSIEDLESKIDETP